MSPHTRVDSSPSGDARPCSGRRSDRRGADPGRTDLRGSGSTTRRRDRRGTGDRSSTSRAADDCRAGGTDGCGTGRAGRGATDGCGSRRATALASGPPAPGRRLNRLARRRPSDGLRLRQLAVLARHLIVLAVHHSGNALSTRKLTVFTWRLRGSAWRPTVFARGLRDLPWRLAVDVRQRLTGRRWFDRRRD
ncbi:MAG TPA: hypothetical protein VFG35_16615, partial [Actinoplanes sp.]|nr:hypothetical protein [Actinoplanes sp.]